MLILAFTLSIRRKEREVPSVPPFASIFLKNEKNNQKIFQKDVKRIQKVLFLSKTY